MVIELQFVNVPIGHHLLRISFVVKEFTVHRLLKNRFSSEMDIIPHRLKIIHTTNEYIVLLLQNDLFIMKDLTIHLPQQDLFMMKGGTVLLHLRDISMVTEVSIHLPLKELCTLREAFGHLHLKDLYIVREGLPHLKDLYMVREDFAHLHPKDGQNHQMNIHLMTSTIHTQKFYYVDN